MAVFLPQPQKLPLQSEAADVSDHTLRLFAFLFETESPCEGQASQSVLSRADMWCTTLCGSFLAVECSALASVYFRKWEKVLRMPFKGILDSGKVYEQR